MPLLGGGNIVPGIAIVPPLNLTYYGNGYIEIGLAYGLSQKADKSTTSTKTEVDDIMKAKQDTLTVIYPMNLVALVAGYPLLVGSKHNSRIICSTTVDSNKEWTQLSDDRYINKYIQSTYIVCAYTNSIMRYNTWRNYNDQQDRRDIII